MNRKYRNILLLWQLITYAIADPNDALVLKLEKTTYLEVRYKGDWGSICYSKPGFDNNAAKVACQQMGFRSGKFGGKTYLPGTNLKIVLQSVTCTGQEANLSECQLTAPDASSSSCEDAVQVNCESDPALDGLFNVNLIGNPDQANKGILQATKRGLVTGVVTGAVCYDSGTALTVAGIVCKQMGYHGVERQTAASASSSGSFFTAVCKGTEQTLANCTLTPGTKCTSNNVIDVECKLNITTQATFDVRLSQSSQVVAGVNSGTVEVKKYGKWGVICDTGWDINDARVVCRQLGFKGAVATTGFPTNAKFGQGTGTVFWNNIQCSGNEPSIQECNHDEVLGTNACNSVDASGVNCSTEKLPELPYTSTSTQETTSLRTTTTSNSSSANTVNQVVPPKPVNVGVIVGATVGVVCLIVLGILVFVLWKRGITCLGRKTRTPDGNGLYDETYVPNGAFTGGLTGNYLNVGGVYENVSEPVYVNSAFVADQAMETRRDSSEYENMGDIVFNQASIAGNTTASTEESTVQNRDNDANNSIGADGKSQYAKLETLTRSEYADFRGLTAEQLKPI